MWLEALEPAFVQPVTEAAELALLPRGGTVILRNVEAYDERQQQELGVWLESSTARLVTICQEPLFARVEAGQFSADLYYRLNIVLIDAIDQKLSPDSIA
jgi:DNA-binding NtrC family response regulator